MAKTLLPFRIAIVLFLLSAAASLAADAALRVYWRRDAETQKSESGFLILTPVNPKAKLEKIEGQLAASIPLPKRNDKSIDALIPIVTFEKKTEQIPTDHFRVTLTRGQEKDLVDYLLDMRGKTPQELEPGKRFEPVLELRGFRLDGEEATASVIVPTYLELELDGKKTDMNAETAVFRGIYVPHNLDNAMRNAEFWSTDPIVDGKDSLKLQCRASFERETDADVLTLHVLNRLALANALRKAGADKTTLYFKFEPTVPNLNFVMQTVQNPDAKARATKPTVPLLKLRRTQEVRFARRNYRFNSLAPASNEEMPLYIAGTFTNARNPAGQQKSVANFEVKLNMSDKLVPLPYDFRLSKRVAFAPAFFAKMNTSGKVNDENSSSWLAPLSVDFFPGACCKADGKTFSTPFLRRVSLYTGYRGEFARVTGKLSHGVMGEVRTFFGRALSQTVSLKIEPIAGIEYGWYHEKTTNTFKKADAAGDAKNPDGTAVSEIIPLERRGQSSRLHGGVHSSIAFAKDSALTVNYDNRYLLKKETYFDEAASASGYFTPFSREGFPSSFPSLSSDLTFISLGQFKKGARGYLDIAFNHTISKFFDIKISYARGSMAPAFQFVNKVEVGLAFRILGKDSYTAR